MFFRKTLATGAAVVLGLTLAQVDAGARGGGGGHGGGFGGMAHGGMGPGFGRGSFGGHSPQHNFADQRGHFDEHGREHQGREGREGRDRGSRMAGGSRFGHGEGAALGGHFGTWQPGHWHVASGFGGGERFSPGLQGVWGR